MKCYLTHDEVNEQRARDLAEAWGAELLPLSLRDGLPDGAGSALLIDWDSLDPDGRERVLARLLAGPRRRIGLHSYGLPEEDARMLQRKGVAVFERFYPDALGWLLDGSA
jgi:hypothetical protein